VKRIPLIFLILLTISVPYGHAQDIGVERLNTCAAAIDATWLPEEQFVWNRVCSGKVANFKGTDFKRPVVRSNFLATILLDEKYRSKLTRRGVDIRGVYIDRPLELENTKLEHELHLIGATFGGDVRLSGLKSTLLIDFTDSQFLKELDLSGVRLDGDLLIGGKAVVKGDVDLGGATIRGVLDFRGATIERKLDMSGLEIGSHLRLARGTFAEIDLTNATIRRDLDLSGATMRGDLDLTSSQILGEFTLVSDDDGSVRTATWSDNAKLILHNARAEIVTSGEHSWPQVVQFQGFTYRSFEPHGAAINHLALLAKEKTYSPEPYERLAQVLTQQGNTGAAMHVRHAGRDHERNRSGGWRYAQLTMLDWLIGYGYHPERALYWALGLILIGAVLLRTSGQGASNGMPVGLAYSFDMLLPIIQLRKKHHDIDLKGALRYYFYGHKIAGYVLASFLIAGLAGLTK
jgi:uncharacterized protein YjbI with pentapeptide repeats